jgi:F-type H+-transporting ATPase subunit a
VVLAEQNLLTHLMDHPWHGWQVTLLGMKVTLMSSAIAVMLLTAATLVAVILPMSRRRGLLPTGGYNVLELLVIFVRDRVARPALHDKAYAFLPFLLTIFVFVLGMNLTGFLHLDLIVSGLAVAIPWLRDHPIGMQPTVVLTACGGLAMVTLGTIMGLGIKNAAHQLRAHRGWPTWLCLALGPVVWVKSLAPSIPGAIGIVLVVPLAFLEFVGALAKCFSLMVRLFANMLAGHAMLAAMMMFILMALESMIRDGTGHLIYIGPLCVVGSAMISLIELLVAGLQAYIFTFLTAIFLGLYVEPEH